MVTYHLQLHQLPTGATSAPRRHPSRASPSASSSAPASAPPHAACRHHCSRRCAPPHIVCRSASDQCRQSWGMSNPARAHQDPCVAVAPEEGQVWTLVELQPEKRS
eukprot:357362-Chlamydomonas_euryale.AAC.4